MILPSSQQVLFPLLCPVREAEWLPGWTAQILHSHSGVAEEGCVFTTPGDGPEPWTWVIARHDAPDGLIRFVVTVPGSHVRVLDIEVRPTAGGCEAVWTYVLTALNEAGEAALTALLTDFLRAGSMLEADPAQA
jgi:hypothetical protein